MSNCCKRKAGARAELSGSVSCEPGKWEAFALSQPLVRSHNSFLPLLFPTFKYQYMVNNDVELKCLSFKARNCIALLWASLSSDLMCLLQSGCVPNMLCSSPALGLDTFLSYWCVPGGCILLVS